MKKKFSKKTFILPIIQILFLGIFIYLILNHSLQKWLPIFGAGVILSLFFSRFYCGWMCQMNTIFRPINWVYSKLGINRLKTPAFFKHRVVRYIFLIIVISSMILSVKFKLKANILLYVTIASILVTLIFEESFWHNNICPYGTILSLSSKPSKFSVKIDNESCIACGLCQKVCPVESIETLDTKKRKVIKNDCIDCFKCQEVCPVDAISYKS